jgi:membrane protein implicated in regulation of membrane protease activity
MLMPGAAVVLWFLGLSGFIVGGTLLVIDLTWQSQLAIFATLGVTLLMIWVWLDRARRTGNDDAEPRINERGPSAMVGRVFRLEKPIRGGHGILTTGGTAWRVAGRDCAAGKQVKVRCTEGTLLLVDPVER